MLVKFKVFPAECPGCAGTGEHTFDDRPLTGKLILRPETAEERAQMARFLVHVRSPQDAHRFEVVFKHRPAPTANGAAPVVKVAGVTSSGDEVGESDAMILERIERDLRSLRRERRRSHDPVTT